MRDPSYLVARPSRDVIVLAHQEMTRLWWEERAELFDVYISALVLQEAGQGNQEFARKRLEVLSGYSVLAASSEIEQLAQLYLVEIGLPGKALRDAGHLAFACGYGLEFLLTWNCAHIANAEIRRRLTEINLKAGVKTPIICTPEELMGVRED